MKSISRELQITEVIESEQCITIIAQDLAIRNFGGKFAKTILTFDLQGKILNEMAHV